MTRDRKLELNIGRTKDLLDKGFTISEICETLELPESAVRRYKDIIDKAELNRRKEEEF